MSLAHKLRRILRHQPTDPVATWAPRASQPGLRSVLWRNEVYDALADADQWSAIERLLPSERSAVLDLGCGTGRMTDRLADRFQSYTGADLPTMVEVARSRIDRPNVEYIASKVQDLALPPSSFDLALSMACLASACTFDQMGELMPRLAATLRPSGRLVLIDPFHRIPALVRTCRATADDVVKIAAAHGLAPVEHSGLHLVPARLALAGWEAPPKLTTYGYRAGEAIRRRGPRAWADYHVLAFEAPPARIGAP